MRRERRQGGDGRAVRAAAGASDEAGFHSGETGQPPAGRLRTLLARQALAVGRHRAALARRLGLSDTEMAALVCLEQTGAMTPGELRARLSLSSGGTTALIQRLVRAGHVERQPHPFDRRSAVISPSETTLAQLSGLTAPLVQALDAAAAPFTPQERATIGAWLDRILAATEAEAEAAGVASTSAASARGQRRVSNAWF